MSKSEQMIQNEIYSNNTIILDKYECLSLGATTINNLMRSSIIKEYSVNKQVGIKKPDVLIIDSEKNVIIYVEQKRPSKLKSEKDIKDAIQQELFVAKAINAKIYVVSDGSSYIWINPKTGNPIVDENSNRINLEIKPKENGKEVAKLINDILLSINDKSDQILKKEFLDPTDLAVKINRKLVNLTFASAKMSLYTFVELFLFKYLSDIGVLRGDSSFSFITNMYKEDYKKIDPSINDAKVLGKYLDGPRETMKTLFPEGEDGTSIINGQVFHVKKDEYNQYISLDNTDKIFREVVLEFENYEKENGKFINISTDFKSKLFETFMKHSDEKSNMGQFFTPLKIVNEMIEMVDIYEGMSICDPACGFRVIIMTVANSSVKSKVLKLLPKLKTEETDGLCVA